MDKRDLPIAAPCHLDWRRMTPADGGRFCGDCKKVVRDISSMGEEQARALLREPGARDLCVRYLHDRDGKIAFATDERRLLPASLLAKGKRAALLAAAVAVPMAIQACALPSTSLEGTSDSLDHSSDNDSGLIESMGGMSAPEDGGSYDTDADAALDAAADATPDADPNADPDASQDGGAAPDASETL